MQLQWYYILAGATVELSQADKNGEQVTFKNCTPLNDCITKISNTQVDRAKDLDVLILMYNLIEYSDNYSKLFGVLYQFCRDEPLII